MLQGHRAPGGWVGCSRMQWDAVDVVGCSGMQQVLLLVFQLAWGLFGPCLNPFGAFHVGVNGNS